MQGRHITDPTFGRRLNAVLSVAPVVVAALALLVIGIPKATGHEWRTIVTGSMRPMLEPGDVVLLSPVADPIAVGDVVAFQDPIRSDRDILHRVAAITESGRLITRGDNNDIDDPWEIDTSQVIGSQVLALPKLGFIVDAASTKPGILIFLVLPALIILGNEGRVWYRYVKYGPGVFEGAKPGRHLPPRGRHLGEART